MIINKKGTSIVEAIIVMAIVTIGVIGTYDIYSRSQKLSDSSANKIQAISLAREGIEAMINIRDTNWLLYSANTKNCWNTYNYDSNCVLSDVDIGSGSYIVYKNTSDRWILEPKTTGLYSSQTYRNDFKVNLDNNGFYTQSGGILETKPLFTREIKISYPNNTGTPLEKMNVESIVRWVDSSKDGIFEIKFQTLLTNWKR